MARLIHNNAFYGSCLCIGLIFIAAGIIIGAVVLEVAVPSALLARNEFDYSDTEEDCSIDNMNFYFFNLTNPEAFLAGLERPNYQQVGPYNFTRRSCVFDKQANDSLQSYRKYWDLPVIRDNSVGKATDRLVNLNPGFLGVMKALASAPDAEYALFLNALPTALNKVITGMQSPSFRYQVTSKGVEVGYNTIFSQAIPKLQVVIRGGAGLTFINDTLASLAPVYQQAAPLYFFNDHTIQGSVANITGGGSDLTFQPQSISNILSSWTSDRVLFSGLINFALSGSSAAAFYQANYSISPTEYALLKAYAANFLMTYVPELHYGGAAGVNATAYQFFYAQWSNATLLPGGYDLDSNPASTKDFFEVGTQITANGTIIIVPSGISSASAAKLWNASFPNSFMTSGGILFWLQASNEAVRTQLMADFGVTAVQVGLISSWINQWNSIVVPNVVASINSYCNCSFTNLNQMPWAQWGRAAVLSGGSLAAFESSLYVPPEFSVVSTSQGYGVQFGINKSEDLLNGTNGFLKTGNIIKFMTLLSQNQTTAIAQLWGINLQETIALSRYFNYLALNLILPTFTNQVFPQNSGLIITKAPLEWMYTGNDSFLAFLGQDPNMGVLSDSDEASSKEQAQAQAPRTQGVYHGGGKDKLRESLEIKQYKGNTTLYKYTPPVDLSGNIDGTQFVPGLSQTEDLHIFTSILVRSVTFRYVGKTVTKGINTYRYDAAEENWQSQTENPANAPYSQVYHGLINVTAYKKARSFYSRPNWYGVDDSIRYQVTGLHPNETYYQTWSIDVEPESGITMQKRLPGQLSLGVEKSNYFYPNVVPGIYPLAWLDDSKVLTDDDARMFKDEVGGAKTGSYVALSVGPAIGIIIIVVVLYLRKTTSRDAKNFTFEKESKSVEMDIVIPNNKEETKLTEKKEESEESSSGSSSSESSSESESE